MKKIAFIVAGLFCASITFAQNDNRTHTTTHVVRHTETVHHEEHNRPGHVVKVETHHVTVHHATRHHMAPRYHRRVHTTVTREVHHY